MEKDVLGGSHGVLRLGGTGLTGCPFLVWGLPWGGSRDAPGSLTHVKGQDGPVKHPGRGVGEQGGLIRARGYIDERECFPVEHGITKWNVNRQWSYELLKVLPKCLSGHRGG